MVVNDGYLKVNDGYLMVNAGLMMMNDGLTTDTDYQHTIFTSMDVNRYHGRLICWLLASMVSQRRFWITVGNILVGYHSDC